MNENQPKSSTETICVAKNGELRGLNIGLLVPQNWSKRLKPFQTSHIHDDWRYHNCFCELRGK